MSDDPVLDELLAGEPPEVENVEVERLDAPRIVTADQISGSAPGITGDLTIDEYIARRREV